jgi:D-3-phosphoglycerate dehydrogenase / 2-oxoglutarate reductase
MSTNPPSSPHSINVAIDLDGVLTEHPRPLAIAANAKFGMDLPESAFIDSAGLNVPMAVRDWVYGPDGPAASLFPAPEAQEFIARMIELVGIDHVRILTARPASSVEMTRAWLRRHGFPEISILFSDDKAEVAATEKCTFAVEDSVRHAVNYARSGITSFLILTESTPAFEAHERIWPVQNLMSIIYRLDEINRENERLAAIAEAGLPRIVVADQIDPAARARLAASAELIDVDGTNLAALLAVLPDADALVVRSETQVTEEVLAAAPRLRVVARAGVGVDNVDLDAATRRGCAGPERAGRKPGLRRRAHDRPPPGSHPPDHHRRRHDQGGGLGAEEDQADRSCRTDHRHRGFGTCRIGGRGPAQGLRDAYPRLRSVRAT